MPQSLAVVDDHGVLKLFPVDLSPVGDHEVLIRVRAAGVNRADLLQRRGRYPVPPGASPTLGLEVAGVLEEIGSKVEGWKVGDEVFTLLTGGGYAEHCIAPAALLWKKPEEWSFEYAAAIPEGVFTAFLNLVIEGELSFGEDVLIEGGSSGVGTFAIQIAKKLGADVTATAGGATRVTRVLELGANRGIDHRLEGSFPSDERFDLILNIMGGETLERDLQSLKSQGRIVVIAVQGGARAEVNLISLMAKRAKLIGSVLRSRTLSEKLRIKQLLDQSIGSSILKGEIKPIVDSVFPLKDVEKAHARMEAGEHFGKIVLTL